VPFLSALEVVYDDALYRSRFVDFTLPAVVGNAGFIQQLCLKENKTFLLRYMSKCELTEEKVMVVTWLSSR